MSRKSFCRKTPAHSVVSIHTLSVKSLLVCCLCYRWLVNSSGKPPMLLCYSSFWSICKNITFQIKEHPLTGLKTRCSSNTFLHFFLAKLGPLARDCATAFQEVMGPSFFSDLCRLLSTGHQWHTETYASSQPAKLLWPQPQCLHSH